MAAVWPQIENDEENVSSKKRNFTATVKICESVCSLQQQSRVFLVFQVSLGAQYFVMLGKAKLTKPALNVRFQHGREGIADTFQ